jgi:hypothetical protein
VLTLTVDDYIQARNGLIDKGLIAFDGRQFQVLGLPPSARCNSNMPFQRTAGCIRNNQDFSQ